MIQLSQKEYEYWFSALLPLTSQKKIKLREAYEDLEELWHDGEKILKKAIYLNEKDRAIICESIQDSNPQKAYEDFLKKAGKMVTWVEDDYPLKLRNIPSSPYALFYKGELPKKEKVSVAVVGARGCSAYGKESAMEYAGVLANAGIQIISGMARGIDGYAQRSALEAGGLSYGVLGCGIDICYPREHIGLYQDLCQQGGVISEFPVQTKPISYNFPMRNRLISGLSDVVIIIEAKEKSGSLITADQALEQGRDVYALPGSVKSQLSRGCHLLIRQGAGILISPQELLEDLDISGISYETFPQEKEKMLESSEKLLYSCFGLYPKNLETLLSEIDSPVSQVMSDLMSLEIKGYIEEVSKNYYIRTS